MPLCHPTKPPGTRLHGGDSEVLPAALQPTQINSSCCFTVEVIERDPVFSRENQYFQTQNERYEAAVRKAVHLQKKMHEMGWREDGPEFIYIYRWLFFFFNKCTSNFWLKGLLANNNQLDQRLGQAKCQQIRFWYKHAAGFHFSSMLGKRENCYTHQGTSQRAAHRLSLIDHSSSHHQRDIFTSASFYLCHSSHTCPQPLSVTVPVMLLTSGQS